ncbi:oxidoreductase [Halobacteriales archaeon QH_8_64_26]|nr:MAG: oxidoreductase [Halobacteriales archaeon QH_8_64_26]
MIVELLIGLCLLGSVVLFVAPSRYAGRLAAGWSLLPLALSLFMYAGFSGQGNAFLGGQLAYETTVQWVSLGPYTLNWHVGLDGISMPLIALSTVLTTAAILSAWTPIEDRENQFYGLVLFLEASLVGVFAALDFFVWFVFWEAVLVPMYFLIAIWGGPRRKYAAIKFFVYTNVASLVMFIGFFALIFGLGDSIGSLDMPAIAQALRAGELGSLAGVGPATLKTLAFAAMFAGFAVKVPVVPVHTWLPDAHVEAPTPVSVLLAGVLLKMGTYALLRFNFTMLADVAQRYAAIIALFAVVSVIYGALLALAQQDLKRIVAYSSVSSMGYVILGLVAYTVYGVGGATFQMLSHGLISGLLFACVGVIYNTTHTRMVDDMSGMAARMPVTTSMFVAGAFAYMGLPLTSGFLGEYFVFLGTFHADFPGAAWFTAIAMFGIVIVAGYLLYAMQRTLFGPFGVATDHGDGGAVRTDGGEDADSGAEHDIKRAAAHDVVPLAMLLALVIVLGVAPEISFGMIRDAVAPLLTGGAG